MNNVSTSPSVMISVQSELIQAIYGVVHVAPNKIVVFNPGDDTCNTCSALVRCHTVSICLQALVETAKIGPAAVEVESEELELVEPDVDRADAV